METTQEHGTGDDVFSARSPLMFRWNELSSHLTNALRCMGSCSGPQPKVYIHFGEKQMRVHATLLAALSSLWRKHLHAVIHQDAQIIHHILADIPVKQELLSALKSLMYCGSVISSIPMSEVMNVAKALDLDNTEFLHSSYSNDLHSICWKGYQERLMETFQLMCAKQLCTDVSILVDGHIMKAHKLILSACSSVLKDAFQENGRIGIIHLPNIGVMNVQSLITYMYYGEALVLENYLAAFHTLCSSLEVVNLKELTKLYVQEEREAFTKEQADCLKLRAQITSSLKGVWGRLCQLYHGEGKTDLTFLVEKKRLSANKALVSAASPQIHDMLAQELTHDHSLILITDMNYESLQGLLGMICNGSCTLAYSSGAVVCSYFDRSLFDVESSEIGSQNKCELNNTRRDEKSRPYVPFFMKQRQKVAVVNSSSEIMDEHSDTNTLVSTEKRKTSCTLEKSKYLRAADGTALSKAHEAADFQTGDDFERKEQFMPHWNSAEAAQLCRNTSDEASTSHNSEKLNTNVTSSSVRGLRTNACCKCKLELCSSLRKEHTDTHKGNEYLEHLSWTGEGVSDDDMPDLGSRPTLKKESYCCLNCEKVFLPQTSLKLPSLLDHCVKDIPKSCGQCGKKFVRTLDSRDHISTHAGDCPYNGKHCEKFAHRGLMHQHLQTHQGEPESQMSEHCGNSCSCKAQRTHMKAHKCPQCKKRFSLKNLLDDHIQIKHSGEVQHDYKCNKCLKSFISSSRLRNHIHRVHLAREAVEYACKQCNLTYKTERHLLAHMQSHGVRVKSYKCSSCSSSFYHHRSLVIHIQKMHPLEMPFTCSGCDEQFSRSDTMMKHKQKCRQRCSQPVTLEGVTEEMKSYTAPASGWPSTQCGQNLSDIEAMEQRTIMLQNSTTMLLEEKRKAALKVKGEGIANQNVSSYPVSVSQSCSCPDCGETFPDIASLGTHAAEQNHAGVNMPCWICGLCGGAFLEEDQLTKHLVVHKEYFKGHLVSSDSPNQVTDHVPDVTGKQFKRDCFSVGTYSSQFDENFKHSQKFLNSSHVCMETNEMGERVTACENAEPTEVPSLLIDSGNVIEVLGINAPDVIGNSELSKASTVRSHVISVSSVAQGNVMNSVTTEVVVAATPEEGTQQYSHVFTSSGIIENVPVNALFGATPRMLETSPSTVNQVSHE